MSQIEIIFIRHGEASDAWGDHLDPGLSDNGILQANNLLNHKELQNLKDFSFMSSPKSRAIETGKPLAKKFDKKLKKETDLLKEVKLVLNKDILKELSNIKSDKQIVVGFALETDDEVNNAKLKLKNKNLNAIVMNSLNDPGSGFDSETNQVTFITELISKKINLNSKSVVAHEILTEIANL